MILPPAAAARFNVLQFMYPLQWSASGSLERSKRAFLISGTQASHATVCYGSLADVIARCRISPSLLPKPDLKWSDTRIKHQTVGPRLMVFLGFQTIPLDTEQWGR